MDKTDAREASRSVLDAMGAAVIADEEVLETVLLGILARGHVLLEDVPGTGKTLTARSMARALGLSFSRIQFTPDLLPTDVTGTHVFNEKERTFEFREGPIFANVVLGDEINRAPPKTQAALLEAMEERQVTVGGDTYELPDPFFVIATQNPVESEGSLHPDETLYMDGRLWRAGDALAYAKENGDLAHDGEHTRLYDAGSTTQTLGPDGTMAERDCLVYETDYDGRIYTVETKTGRRIRVSGNHPFLVNRGGGIRWVQARDLDSDDTLVTPERLTTPSKPLPTHEEALDRLESEYDVVRRERVADLRARLDAGEPLSREDLDDLRIACGYSKKDLAAAVSSTYDQVLNYLGGAENAAGEGIRDVLSGREVAAADYVESFTISRFEDELTDAEAGFFVGFVLADGHHTDTSVRIYQKNYPDLFDRWTDLARKLGFDPRIRDIHGGREAAIDSKPLVDYLDERYRLTTPSAVLTAPEEFRHAFLDAFLLAESHFDAERRRVTFTQKDAETTNLIAHLLLGFGIRPWIDDRERVYRLKIQGVDLRAYLEQFTWPGETPDVSSFESSHRTTPVEAAMLDRVVDLLGLRYAGDMSERDWYNSYSRLDGRTTRMRDDKLDAFVRDVEGELSRRRARDVDGLAEESLATVARGCGLSMTDIVDATDLTKHRVWQSYEGAPSPEQAVEYVTTRHRERMGEAERLTAYLRELMDGDVFYDPVADIESEPYEGTVVGLSVPRTHNYVAGLGACGINHNTFPLPEAQVDRFAVKTSLGYPDMEGEIELLRRRAGRTTRSPEVERVLDGESDVRELQSVPEDVHVDDDLLEYIAAVTRATREDRNVEVGVSPRGTQRLFEAARARAVLVGRDYLTPDDVKRIAVPTLAHRLVLTPDASVSDVSKTGVIRDVLEGVPVPTVE